jgi:hypothetical protein
VQIHLGAYVGEVRVGKWVQAARPPFSARAVAWPSKQGSTRVSAVQTPCRGWMRGVRDAAVIRRPTPTGWADWAAPL